MWSMRGRQRRNALAESCWEWDDEEERETEERMRQELLAAATPEANPATSDAIPSLPWIQPSYESIRVVVDDNRENANSSEEAVNGGRPNSVLDTPGDSARIKSTVATQLESNLTGSPAVSSVSPATSISDAIAQNDVAIVSEEVPKCDADRADDDVKGVNVEGQENGKCSGVVGKNLC